MRSRAVQLRIRITEKQKQSLEQLTLVRGRGESISDIIRYIIDLHATSTTVTLDDAIVTQLTQMAEEVNRSKSKVVQDCIVAVLGLLESDRSPLIVEEIKLRRSYASQRAAC
jgi:negative regulator of replication initiation